MSPLETVVYTYLAGSLALLAVPAVSYTLEGTLTMSQTPPATATTTATAAPAADPSPAPTPASHPSTPPPVPVAAPGTFVSNPIGLLNTGSGSGSSSKIDIARSVLFYFGAFGLVENLDKAYSWYAGHQDEISTALTATVAATTLVTHLLHSFFADNTAKVKA